MAMVSRAKGRPKIFYGWYVLGVVMLGAFAGAGSSQLYMSVMLKPLSEEFGWSRTAATGAVTAGTLCAGLLAPLFGYLADRYGPRWLTTIGALVSAGLYSLLANLSELWQLYVVYTVGRSLVANTLGGVVPMTAATNWFRRMRGRALGLVSMAFPLASSSTALVGQVVMDNYGWRMVYVLFAGATAAMMLPAALVLRRRPEDLGLLPDGDEAPVSAASPAARRSRADEYSWTLAQAMRTRSLWLLAVAIGISVMANTAVGFHQVAYFTDIGLAATAAAIALGVYGFCGAAASGIWGFLTEHFSERYLAVGSMLLAAAVVLFLLTVQTFAGALVFAVLFGLASRGEGTLVNIILAQYYGRNAYGAISGFVHPFQMVGLGLGPLLASISFDVTGSYQLVFHVFTGVFLVSAALLWLAKKPVPAVRAAA